MNGLKQNDTEDQMDKTEVTARFWAAPDDALFTRDEIATVRRCSVAKLDREAWLGGGIKFVRDGGRCLYRKGDVTATLKKQQDSPAA